MVERLQKILSARGIASRRKAEEMILQGRVCCNGRVCRLGEQADPDRDQILVDGKPLPAMGKRICILLHKPRGYVTTLSDEKGRRNAAQLVSDCGCYVYPAGRLDMDSEGLLIFTNDGELANMLMHPRHEVQKVYRVTVDRYTEEAENALRRPIVLDGYQIRTPDVKKIRLLKPGRAELEVTIHEGRNRQVRRMCAEAGLEVRRLIRIQEGGLRLGDLPCGKWRLLTEWEIEVLKK